MNGARPEKSNLTADLSSQGFSAKADGAGRSAVAIHIARWPCPANSGFPTPFAYATIYFHSFDCRQSLVRRMFTPGIAAYHIAIGQANQDYGHWADALPGWDRCDDSELRDGYFD